MEEARALAQPQLLRNIEIFGKTLPVNIVTVTVLLVGGAILFRGFTQKSTAEASHILIEDHSEETKTKLEKIKEAINNNPETFASYAKKYSTCPSGKSAGGNLGKFSLGDMVPAFDKVVFSPKSKIGVVYGPIHTHFGWHLILIHKRNEQRQMVLENDSFQ